MRKPDDADDRLRGAGWQTRRAGPTGEAGSSSSPLRPTTKAGALIERVASLVGSLPRSRPALVAVDGADAAGKTTFADSLATALGPGRTVVRIEGDDFEQPRAHRYRLGRDSPVGFFEDTYDHDAFEARVLRPLTAGDRRIVRRIYDRTADAPVDAAVEEVPADGVVIVDGCFLLRRQLREYWSLGVFLVVAEGERLRRAQSRDRTRLGGRQGVVTRYRTRYFPGFDLYLEREDPLRCAHIVVDNEDVDRPVVLRWPSADLEAMGD